MQDLQESTSSDIHLTADAPNASASDVNIEQTVETPQESVLESKPVDVVENSDKSAEEVKPSVLDEKLVPQHVMNAKVGDLRKQLKDSNTRLQSLQKQQEELISKLKTIEDPHSPEAISMLAKNEVVNAQVEQERFKINSEIESSINSSEAEFAKNHPDYHQKVNAVGPDFARIHQVNPLATQLLAQVSNPAAVIYKLSTDLDALQKFASFALSGMNASLESYIHSLDQSGQSDGVQKVITQPPPKPVSQVTPSPKANVGEGKIVTNGLVNLDNRLY